MDMLILGFFIGIVIAWATMYFMLRVVISRVDQQIEQVLEAAVAAENASGKIEILARVEMHDDTFYVYNKETNEFMAQGKTLKEIKEHMFKRYDKTKYNVIADPANDADILVKLKATTQEATE